MRHAAPRVAERIETPRRADGATVGAQQKSLPRERLARLRLREPLAQALDIGALDVQHAVRPIHEVRRVVTGHGAQAVVREKNLQPTRAAAPPGNEHALALSAQRGGEQRGRCRGGGVGGLSRGPLAVRRLLHGASRSTDQPSFARR